MVINSEAAAHPTPYRGPQTVIVCFKGTINKFIDTWVGTSARVKTWDEVVVIIKTWHKICKHELNFSRPIERSRFIEIKG